MERLFYLIYCLRFLPTTDVKDLISNTPLEMMVIWASTSECSGKDRWANFRSRSMWIRLDCLDQIGLFGSSSDTMLRIYLIYFFRMFNRSYIYKVCMAAIGYTFLKQRDRYHRRSSIEIRDISYKNQIIFFFFCLKRRRKHVIHQHRDESMRALEAE